MKHSLFELNSTSELSIRDWLDTFSEIDDWDEWGMWQLCAAGWWDWFERREGVRVTHTKKCVKILQRIMTSKKIDIDNMYVWFKQSLCGDGTLTESLKISDKKTGDVLYSIGHVRGRVGWELWDFTEGSHYENTKWEHEVFEHKPLTYVYRFFAK